mgnify:FL=1
MQKVLIIIHAAPYGSERCLSGLRVAAALAAHATEEVQLRIFLMSDASFVGLPNQQDGSGNGSGLQAMVEQLVDCGATIRLCRTCALARGVGDLPLIKGLEIGTLSELANWTLDADKVLTF